MVAPCRYARRTVYSIRNDIMDSPCFYRFFEKLLFRSSYVVTNSMKVLHQYSRYFKSSKRHIIRNIYNGFDVGKFLFAFPPPVSEKMILGTVGRQAVPKNQIQILKAVDSVIKLYPLHFYLIGDKHQNMALENESYVRERNLDNDVTILDSVSAIENYYRCFNIFILSSVNESCPNVLFEAMLSKCLCIVSTGSNSDHFIVDGLNGLVYDGSLMMLEEKIVQAISMVRTGAHFGLVEEGQKYANANFSLNRMISEYKELYYELIKDNSK
ncbi:MAG: glycosyltransferase family 4 protein [Bacteroidales bacterium]|nr:glycosyltransferase family 4 protein [Bacteroidales bacterium]